MVEIKGNNSFFQFKITDYEFPDTDDRSYDGNWLMIEINVKKDDLKWSRRDPSLLTWDLKEIVKWFYDLSNNKELEWKDLGFTEPNLKFEYERSNNKTKVFIYFRIELLPDNWDKKNKCFVEFELTNEELYNIGKMFEEELTKFQVRE